MQEDRKLYLEVVTSAFQTSGFVEGTLTEKVFDGYLELLDEKEKVAKKLRDEYRGTSKKYYNDSIDIQEIKDDYANKVNSLETILHNLNVEKYDKLDLNDDGYQFLHAAFEFYQFKTGHKKHMPIKIFRLNNTIFNRLHNIFKQIGKDSLELSILNEVKSLVALTGIYQPINEETDIILVDKVADACWELYESNNEISTNQLIQETLSKYHIKSYDHCSPQETRNKTENAIKQWIRDVKKHSGIEISN